MTLRTKYDVAVVGGGPVGCVTALAFAQKGASVVVLEADPRASKRFAGEWLHPAGVAVLDRLRAGRLDGASARTGYGFVIVPDDGGSAVEMTYPNGVALAAEHSDIVEALRTVVHATPNIEFVPNVRVLGIDGHVVRGEDRLRSRPLDLEAERIVGADGRNSVVRQSLGFPDHSSILSYMACVELRDVELPFESFGHVILGGPGPMLLYRISENRIRGCLDVPLTEGPRSRTASYLWDAFANVMPEGTKEAFRDSLNRAPLVWAANRFRPRSHFGRDHVALVGDAVGHTHPLTALGMTNGFLDAQSLAESKSLLEYENARRAHVPEVLSNALYHCFRRADAGATSLRAAMMDVLRKDESERQRTLRIMAGEDGSKRSFGGAFMRMAAHAASRVVKDSPRRRDVPERLVAFAEWMQWPVAGLLPQRLVPRRLRARASMKSPLPLVEELTEAFRLPARERPEGDRRLTEIDARPAIAKASDLLLRDLEGLAVQFGTAPDHELALPALLRLRAIDATLPGAGMSARLTMARRRLSREGAPRLLGLVTDGQREQWAAEDLAELFSFVLAGDRTEPVVGLLEGVRALLSCASEGGFASRPGGRSGTRSGATLATTEVVLRALLDAVKHRPSDLPADIHEKVLQAREDAALFTRGRERTHAGGAFIDPASGEDETAHAIQVLVLVGTPATDPLMRRAVHSLSRLQGEGGQFGDVPATARALSALVSAGVPALDVTTRAARVLAFEVEQGRLAGESLALALTALGAFSAQRNARPIAATRARKEEAASTVGVTVAAPVAAPVTAPVVAAPAPIVERPPVQTHARVEATRADWEYCKVALGEVSRTFARPIALLPDELEVAVTLGYLLCRVADTVEDHTAVTNDIRDELFALFLGVLERGEDAAQFAAAFDKIPGSDAELDLARKLPQVMAVYRSQSEAMQDATVRWVSEMARGMALYSHRRAGKDGMIALETVQDLERYCYYVAGTVGHFLTDVFLIALGDAATPELGLALRKDAEDFAEGLQLVNILKDVTDDRARGWSFVPRTACADRGLGVPELVDPGQRKNAHAAVAPLFDIARGKLEGALRYALTIPKDQAGIRLFCLLPLWMAARTLVVARGNDAMFVAGAPVKISREEVEAIVAECVKHAADDDFLRARWSELWRENPVTRAAG